LTGLQELWNSIVAPLVAESSPEVIVEIGAGSGTVTDRLLDLDAIEGSIVHSIDPAPAFDVDARSDRFGKRFRFHEAESLAALPEIEGIDLVLVDGDPNWYTVFHELKALERRSLEDGRPFPLVMLHNVRWPHGRRDTYYEPERIPDEYLQPFARGGLMPGRSAPVTDGLAVGLYHATAENGPRNGVRTALDDFLAESYQRWRLVDIPGLSGIGILTSQERLAAAPGIEQVVDRFQSSGFLTQQMRELESARLSAEVERARIDSVREREGDDARRLRHRLRAAEENRELISRQHAEMHARVAELEGMHEAAQLEHDRLMRQLRGVERSLSTAATTRDELEQRAVAAEARLKERDEEVTVLRRERDAIALDLERRRDELDVAATEQARLLTNVEDLEDASADAQRELKDVRREAARVQDAMTAELSALLGRFETAEAERDGMASSLDSAKAEAEAALARAAALENDSVRLTAERAAASRESELVKSQLDEARDALHERTEGAREALARAEAAEASNRALEARVQARDAEIENAEAVRTKALGLAVDVRSARSWRWGHRFFSVLRTLTFRRQRGTNAVDRLTEVLKDETIPTPETD
jgi:hypothetical protein